MFSNNKITGLFTLSLALIGLAGCNSDKESAENSINIYNENSPSELSFNASKTMRSQSITGTLGHALDWDIDKDGKADALTDGLLILRYGFGIRGDALTQGAIASDAILSSAEIGSQMNDMEAIIDIDNNGQFDALTDGLIILRYLFGIRGNPLIDGAVANNASRSSAPAITQYLIDNMPGANSGGIPNTVVINEVSSSNSSFDDEDGDSPDWIELFNNGDTIVDLTGWTITDDSLEPNKWVFPQTLLAPGSYMRIWASNKDKTAGGTYRTLVNEGDNFRYLIPSSNPSNSWINQSFNDSSWLQGTSGFGYADGDDSTIIPNGTSSVYVRKTFTVADLELMDKLWLDIDFDDGFVAYINGVEIARSNILGDRPSFNTYTITDREATMWQSGSPVRFPINDVQALLNEGENILSIQVHNANANSSDMTLIPFLSAFYLGSTNDGQSPPTILGFEDPSLHTNFKISSDGEELTLFDLNGGQVDYMNVTAMENDNSMGRSPVDGSILYFENPTPGEQNPSIGFLGAIESEVVFSHQGGEFN